MGTDKRQRKKANRAARLELETKQARRQGLIRRLTFLAVFVVGALGLALLVNLLAGDDDGAANLTPETDGVAAGTQPATSTTATGAAEEPIVCPPAEGAAERTTEFAQAPPQCIDPERSYSATVHTDLGDFTIDLDAEAAPVTVNNFVFLARHQYYDGVPFHRIVPGFVVQGGDANGDPPGTGGPGYRFADELPAPGSYQIGSVAMANSGPDTNGSQFFIVTGEDGVALDPLYSLFGQVSAGMDTVMAIEATSGTDETPVIEDVTITES